MIGIYVWMDFGAGQIPTVIYSRKPGESGGTDWSVRRGGLTLLFQDCR